MSTIVSKDNPPVTLKHIKGNGFNAEFSFAGITTISTASAKVYRIDDADKTQLIGFAVGSGIAISSGNIVTLTKTDASITYPSGWYGFEMTANADGISQKVIKNSIFIIE